ncbi:MAG: ABC transporter substrate-binding protein, partial [Treponema sp.]|nr:ABC transporter substrate-binding protein [Treponema sp.]
EFTEESGFLVPNAAILGKNNTAYYRKVPADEKAAEGITLELKSRNEEFLIGELTNHSGNMYSFGRHFYVEKKINGDWYRLPPALTNYAWEDILCLLEDGQSTEVEFSVFSMSDLPSALANGAVDAVAMSDPQGSVAEAEYGLRCIIDTAKDDDYKDEYCCISFVTDDIKTNHPEVAKNFTKAIMEASLWVQANPDETAKIQVEKNWVSGDAEFNASVLKQYNYKPSLKGGLEALKTSAPAIKELGLIKETTDIDEFINNCFYELEGITDEEIYADSGVTEEELAASAEAKADAAAVLSTAKLEELEDCCKEEAVVEEKEEKECCKHKNEQSEEHHEEEHEKKDCCKEETK